MKKLAILAGLGLWATGCATVGSVKALEVRVNDMEKKVAKVEGTVEAFEEKIGNYNSRIATLEANYKVIYDEVNKMANEGKDKDNKTDTPKVKSVK